jgi:hypothetical protein
LPRTGSRVLMGGTWRFDPKFWSLHNRANHRRGTTRDVCGLPLREERRPLNVT